MTKRWSSSRSDLTKSKKQVSRDRRRAGDKELTAVEALMLPLDHPKIKKAIEEAASILETTEN